MTWTEWWSITKGILIALTILGIPCWFIDAVERWTDSGPYRWSNNRGWRR